MLFGVVCCVGMAPYQRLPMMFSEMCSPRLAVQVCLFKLAQSPRNPTTRWRLDWVSSAARTQFKLAPIGPLSMVTIT